MVETALALAVIERGGPATVALLEYLVSGDVQAVFDAFPMDIQLGPSEGWVL